MKRINAKIEIPDIDTVNGTEFDREKILALVLAHAGKNYIWRSGENAGRVVDTSEIKYIFLSESGFITYSSEVDEYDASGNKDINWKDFLSI